MKNGKKNILVIFILLTVLLILVMVIKSSVQYKGIIDVNSDKREVSFYTCKLFRWNIQAIKIRQNIIGLKITDISEKDLKKPEIITVRDEKYVGFVTEDAVKIFSAEGERKWVYNLKDNKEYILSSTVSDLDNDLTNEILMITGKEDEKYGESLVILTIDKGIKEKLVQSLKGLNPWKVQTADVDGDNQKEISISVYKESEFHPIMAKRPFIYNINENGIYPKWRGSRLSRPFDAYIFSDIDKDGKDELISIEILNNGRRIISSYKWKGFGFELFSESDSFEDIFSIKKQDENIYAEIKINNYIQWIALGYDEGKLIVKDRMKDYIHKLILEVQ